jgi:streptogramin lyase
MEGASIVAGTDGNLHLTEPSTRRASRAGSIDQMTTDGAFTRVRLRAANRLSKSITTGPDGNLWFTEEAPLNHGVARLTPHGRLKEFAVPPSATSGGTGEITSGPDGNLWFTRPGGTVDRITPSGIVTEFTVPRTGSDPEGIASGPDGNLWITDRGTDPRIWRVTPAGHFTGYRLPDGSSALGITVGPDDAMWFADYGAASIGRITSEGAITYYQLPSGRPFSIAAGPDGNLWFTEDGVGRIGIGRISPDGSTITEFPLWKDIETVGITAGPDGNMWFTAFPHWIGRITSEGVARRFATPTPGSQPPDIAPGPNGGLWFTEQFGGRAGRVTGA